jgi:hypothetical protein
VTLGNRHWLNESGLTAGNTVSNQQISAMRCHRADALAGRHVKKASAVHCPTAGPVVGAADELFPGKTTVNDLFRYYPKGLK